MEDGIDESFTQGFSGSHVVGSIGRGGGMSQGWGEAGGEWWSASSGGAFGLRYRAGGWAGGVGGHICRSGEAGAGGVVRGGAGAGGRDMARGDGSVIRAAHWTEEGGAGGDAGPGYSVESCDSSGECRRGAGRVCADCERSGQAS